MGKRGLMGGLPYLATPHRLEPLRSRSGAAPESAAQSHEPSRSCGSAGPK